CPGPPAMSTRQREDRPRRGENLMKSSQLVIAFIVLIGMIFGLTFARIYLGNPVEQKVNQTREPLEVNFLYKNFPTNEFDVLEREEHVKGWHDFWFSNPNKETVQLGLHRTSCRCAGAEAFVLPEERY